MDLQPPPPQWPPAPLPENGGLLESERNGQRKAVVEQMSREDKERRQTFKTAYLTEVGDIHRLIDIHEFHDLVVCAGVDIDQATIHEAWPKDKTEIGMNEAYNLFTRLPNKELRIKHLLEFVYARDELPFDKVLETVKNNLGLVNDKKREALVEFIEKWKADKVSPMQALHEFSVTKEELRKLNREISDQLRVDQISHRSAFSTGTDAAAPELEERHSFHPIEDMIPPRLELESNEGDSSVFIDGDPDERLADFRETRSPDELSLSMAQRLTDRSSMIEEPVQHLFKTTWKSLVIQNKNGRNQSMGHVFTIHETQNIKIDVRINERIDQNLDRFQNAICGVLECLEDGTKLVGITMNLVEKMLSTEKLVLLPGTYIFTVNFVIKIEDCALVKPHAIVEKGSKKLSSLFRMHVMNVFDMFDFNDDQVLDFNELSIHELLTGSPAPLHDEFEALKSNFDSRDNGLTMRAFVEMLQVEAVTYETHDYRDMWSSVTNLGFNKQFKLTHCCPIYVDYNSSDAEVIVEKYDIAHWTEQTDLHPWFWEHGSYIPYVNTPVKLWRNDYFGVVVAKTEASPVHYQLTLVGSNNVILDLKSDMVIDKVVQENRCEVLATGVASQPGISWFMSVRKHSVRSSRNSPHAISSVAEKP